MTIKIPNEWKARVHQRALYNNFGHGKPFQRASIIWHRRAGKDSTGLNLTARDMFKRKGVYWHLFPEQAQARKAIWNGIDKQGRRILDQVFPGFKQSVSRRVGQGVIQRVNSQDMLIELKNGSIWQMAGSDNYDSLVGSNPVGVVFSEWALANPLAWDYIRPILLENGGWALFITTPRGRNHAYKTHQMALHNQDWFAEVLPYWKTGLLTEADIQSERDSGMSEAKIGQEYGCDFEAEVDDQFIPSAIVRRAQNAPVNSGKQDPIILGVDCARFGDDFSVIYPRHGLDARSLPVERYAKLDTMQFAARVAAAIDKYNPDAVFIDEGGLGAGVVDRLRQLGYNVIGVNFGGEADYLLDGARGSANKRTSIWENLHVAMKSGLAISKCTRLEFELLAPNYTYDGKNNIMLESKKDMKKRGVGSPDDADALALTYSYPVVGRSIQETLDDQDSDDYDPYDADNL